MDRVGVLVIQYEDVVIAATGGDREVASLVRVGLQNLLVGKKHAAKVMLFGIGGETSSGSTGVVTVGGRGNVFIIWVVGSKGDSALGRS